MACYEGKNLGKTCYNNPQAWSAAPITPSGQGGQLSSIPPRATGYLASDTYAVPMPIPLPISGSQGIYQGHSYANAAELATPASMEGITTYSPVSPMDSYSDPLAASPPDAFTYVADSMDRGYPANTGGFIPVSNIQGGPRESPEWSYYTSIPTATPSVRPFTYAR